MLEIFSADFKVRGLEMLADCSPSAGTEPESH